MAITERTTKYIKTKIKLNSDEQFEKAYSRNSNKIFLRLLREIQSGVINIYGRPGSGRTLVAKKLMYILHLRDIESKVTMDHQNGFRSISKNQALLVMGGTIETKGKDQGHQNIEPYQNYAIKRNGIVIIISSEPISEKYIEFAFQTVGERYDHDDNLEIKTILQISSKLIGSVKFSSVFENGFEELLDKKIAKAKTEFMTDEVQKIIDSIEEHTKDLLNLLLISKKVIFFNSDKLRRRQNDIEPEFNIALGPPGSGKSTLSEIYLYLDRKAHGRDHVHAMSHKKDLGVLLHRGFSENKDHYIQWLKVEDATYELQNDSEVFSNWINIRHLMNEATGGSEEDKSTGIQQGRVKTWLNLHEFEGQACPKAFRQKVNNLWITDIPTNMHDLHLVRNFLEQGVLFDFLKYTSKKYSDAKKAEDTEAMNYWRGWGVCRTAEGLYPYRLHLENEEFEAEYFDIIKVSSQWRETWEDIVDYLIEYFENEGIEKPTTTMINAVINRYEMNEYGRLRPQSEKGINYRKSVADNVKAHFQMISQNASTDDRERARGDLKFEQNKTKSYESYDLEFYDTEVDKEFLRKMIELIPEERKAENLYDGKDGKISDWDRHRGVLYSYYLQSQRDGAQAASVSQASITKWSKQYAQGGKYKGQGSKYWGQGYDAEVTLLEVLGDGWQKGGENKPEPDLYHLEDKKLISLKCIAHSTYWDYEGKVGEGELKCIHDKGFEGELWIYMLGNMTWRKYKIIPSED